jgi:hypothetical protein
MDIQWEDKCANYDTVARLAQAAELPPGLLRSLMTLFTIKIFLKGLSLFCQRCLQRGFR